MGKTGRVGLAIVMLAASWTQACAGKAQQRGANSAAAPAATPAPASPPDDPESSPETKEESEAATKILAQLAGIWAFGLHEGPSETPTSWHRHAASGTCLPLDVPGWEVVNEKTYGPGDEGVSLWKEDLATRVTLYTYPAQGPVDAEFDSVMQVVARTCTEGPVISTKWRNGKIGGCVHRLNDDAYLVEQALVFQEGPWFHKARFTFPAMREAYNAGMGLVLRAFKPCAAQA